MAYIVDLVVVMNLAFKKGKLVTQDDVKDVIQDFEKIKNDVHWEIREFVARRNASQVFFSQDGTLEKIEELIRKYTSNRGGSA